MSVYTELVKIGLADAAASELDDAVRLIAHDLVTKSDIATLKDDIGALRLQIAQFETTMAQFEARLNNKLMTMLVTLTGVYVGLLAAMAGVIVWAIDRRLP